MRMIIPFLLFLSACSGQTKSNAVTTAGDGSSRPQPAEIHHQYSWSGFINQRIPVFLHYTIGDGIIAGELYYLNTKARKPIRVLGTIEDDSSYRLLEFEPGGNISGILTGTPGDKKFQGTWFSPKARKGYSLTLTRKDTTVKAVDFTPAGDDFSGHYHYQYSEAGYHGDLDVQKIGEDRVAFSIFSVTNDPARNLAEVPADTIQMTRNSFLYTIPGSDSCEFRVTFYRGFATVAYTRGYCDGQFGMNATVDGIFLKVVKQD